MQKKQALPLLAGQPIKPRCHVPWQQMVIDSNGTVAPCCYWGAYGNDNPAMGNINDSSIEEIWNGPSYQRLRKFMAADDLKSAGCDRCYALKQGMKMELIHDADADQEATRPESEQTSYYKNLKTLRHEVATGATHLKANPTVISLSPSHRCNLRCTHCYQEATRTLELKKDRFSDEFMTLCSTLIRLIAGGGEPFLLPIWRRFLNEFVHDENPYLDFGTTTNATIVTPEVVNGLRKFKTLTMNISMDGTGTAFETVRVGAKFDEVVVNLRKLKALVQEAPSPRSTFGVTMCVMKNTVRDLPNFVRFATREKFQYGLSPVATEPPDESLACFNDPASEMAGWREAYAEARRLTTEEYAPMLRELWQATVHVPTLMNNYDLLEKCTPWQLLERKHLRVRVDLPAEAVRPYVAICGPVRDLFVYIFPNEKPLFSLATYYAKLIDRSEPIRLAIVGEADDCATEQATTTARLEDVRGPFHFEVSLPAGRYFLGLDTKWRPAHFNAGLAFTVVDEGGTGRIENESWQAGPWKQKAMWFYHKARNSLRRRLTDLLRRAG